MTGSKQQLVHTNQPFVPLGATSSSSSSSSAGSGSTVRGARGSGPVAPASSGRRQSSQTRLGPGNLNQVPPQRMSSPPSRPPSQVSTVTTSSTSRTVSPISSRSSSRDSDLDRPAAGLSRNSVRRLDPYKGDQRVLA